MIEICGHHLVITCSARYLNPLEAPCDPCGDTLRGIFQERRSAPSPSSGESCHMSSKHCTFRYTYDMMNQLVLCIHRQDNYLYT